MNWTLLGGSLAAVLALAGIAWALGLGGVEPLDEAGARAMAEQLVPGFVAASVTLDQDGGAIVVGTNGDGVTLRRHGARWVHAVEPAARG